MTRSSFRARPGLVIGLQAVRRVCPNVRQSDVFVPVEGRCQNSLLGARMPQIALRRKRSGPGSGTPAPHVWRISGALRGRREGSAQTPFAPPAGRVDEERPRNGAVPICGRPRCHSPSRHREPAIADCSMRSVLGDQSGDDFSIGLEPQSSVLRQQVKGPSRSSKWWRARRGVERGTNRVPLRNKKLWGCGDELPMHRPFGPSPRRISLRSVGRAAS